jgi:hypothetical protein
MPRQRSPDEQRVVEVVYVDPTKGFGAGNRREESKSVHEHEIRHLRGVQRSD